jgi:hypothetical protein
MTTAIAVVVGGKRQAKQASQNNTDYTEKQIKPQITRKVGYGASRKDRK